MSNAPKEGPYTAQEAAERLLMVKDQLEALTSEKEALSAFLAAQDTSDVVVEHMGKRYKPIVTVSTRPRVNLYRLKALSPDLYADVVKEVLDTSKLGQTLDAGRWTDTLRAECVTMHETRPGVRFTPITSPTTEDDQ